MTKQTQDRRDILDFYQQFGLVATRAAFHVSRSTLYRWKTRARQGRLEARSTAPHSVRVPVWSSQVLDEIERLRRLYPRIGKHKLTPLLGLFCEENHLTLPSEASIGRMLTYLIKNNRLPDQRRYSWYARTARWRLTRIRPKIFKERRQGYTPRKSGDLVAVDTVVLFSGAVKRYIVTAIDYSSSFAFAYTYKTLSSRTATDFLAKLQEVAPFDITRIQTDNGLEFHKDFHETLIKSNITHFYNYPRRPQMNGKLERFNRTIQEEFSQFRWQTLVTNLDQFNLELMEWLMWYNGVRPHEAQKMTSPLQWLVRTEDLSHMSWSCTSS